MEVLYVRNCPFIPDRTHEKQKALMQSCQLQGKYPELYTILRLKTWAHFDKEFRLIVSLLKGIA